MAATTCLCTQGVKTCRQFLIHIQVDDIGRRRDERDVAQLIGSNVSHDEYYGETEAVLQQIGGKAYLKRSFATVKPVV